ncbi:hypothetical protein M5D96_010183 [Drosophila gunungcola]|uniref:Uncharacterized protein n=1 Tax=Drosophila gunungcola TaxID=103775 RepID=A0A9P9YH45_9MUSC|nr:hypothetical protein M5D96_010183 [Drosophila gunungcola]
MRMLCDRLAALTAGSMVGVWYAKNFPCDASKADDGGSKDKDKAKEKRKDEGKEMEKEKGKDKR